MLQFFQKIQKRRAWDMKNNFRVLLAKQRKRFQTYTRQQVSQKAL